MVYFVILQIQFQYQFWNEIENGFATFRLYNVDIFGAKVLFIWLGIGILGTQNEGRIVS